MKLLLVFTVVGLGLSAQAKDLHCKISNNLDIVFSGAVQTSINQKVLIGSPPGISAYITEKMNQKFSVEAFVALEDVRIFGEGYLRNPDDTVSATVWGRSVLAEVTCGQ